MWTLQWKLTTFNDLIPQFYASIFNITFWQCQKQLKSNYVVQNKSIYLKLSLQFPLFISAKIYITLHKECNCIKTIPRQYFRNVRTQSMENGVKSQLQSAVWVDLRKCCYGTLKSFVFITQLMILEWEVMQ